MGDVGAPVDADALFGDEIGRVFWTNINTWRPILSVGGRMALTERQKIKTMLSTGFLYANDAYGGYPRGYEIRTTLVELTFNYEYYLVREQKKRNIYKYLGASQRFINLKFPIYVFTGVSGIFFNPRTLFDGKWHSLQPLMTEQTKSGKDKYSRFGVAVPFGFGVKFKLAQYISLNVEAGWRLALTDYLDDLANGNYPDFEGKTDDETLLRAAISWRGHGQLYLTDDLREDLIELIEYQEDGRGKLSEFTRGGGDWFDQYQFINFTLNFKLKSTRNGLPRLRLYR